jgi:hypothetical protein
MGIFVDRVFEIDVATVSLDRNGNPRAPETWYSIVRAIQPVANVTTTQASNNPTVQPLNSANLSTHQHSNTVNTPAGSRRKALCASAPPPEFTS